MSIQEISIIVGLAITVFAAVFSIYDRFSKPDIKAGTDIAVLKDGCKIKHKNLDEKMFGVVEDIKLIKENHLRHIEADINQINNTQTKILTILEAKYQIKIEDNK